MSEPERQDATVSIGTVATTGTMNDDLVPAPALELNWEAIQKKVAMQSAARMNAKSRK